MKSDLFERLKSLSPEDRELLKQLLAEEDGLPQETTIKAQSQEEATTPLSFAQQRMWFVSQLEPDSATYNISNAYRLYGELDTQALEKSIQTIVQRHAALRTTFILREGIPQQVIGQEPRFSLPVTDLTHLPQQQREPFARDLVAAEYAKPFDLSRDLMVRTRLLRLDTHDHILSIVMHHIASDGWSMGIFRRELAEAYGAIVDGKTPSLRSLPIQYADYAVWQREWLQGERLKRQLDYWRDQLQDLPLMQLPTDRSRPKTLSFRGASERFDLAPAMVVKLQNLAQQETTTLHTLLLAAYAVLISRTAAQNDFAIGVPVAGRPRTELEPLIGFFVNSLVIRARVGGHPTFREFLRQMKQTMVDALDHQDIPFEKLVEELQPARHLNRNPFFDTLFQFIDLPQIKHELPGLAVDRVSVATHHSNFDMGCTLIRGPNGIAGRWRYATDLFERATVQRLIGHFQTLLAAIASDPNRPIDQLAMLTQEERQQVLYAWNETRHEYPRQSTLHELVSAQTHRTPDHIAVTVAGNSLTYAQLDGQSNQLANYLKQLGVGSEAIVGLYGKHSLEMVVGMLGIIKAGGAYMPIDPELPAARVRFMLQDSGTAVVLTHARDTSAIDEQAYRIIKLGESWSEIAQQPATNPKVEVRPDSLLYVIYTSGSSGTPKGVEIIHRSAINLLHSLTRRPGFGPDDHLLAVTPLSFDPCLYETFLPLIHGARLTIAPHDALVDGRRMQQLVDGQNITFIHSTPSLWRTLLESGWRGKKDLKIISGGEPLNIDLARELQGRCASLWNHYGPTEVTVNATVGRVLPGAQRVPIGRPIDNTQVYILDEQQEPVPIGVAGRLYVAGDGVARGYLHRPEVTAERFMANPFAGKGWPTSPRMYWTGDLARRLPDGQIEFIGREDFQIKIRGYRVELGEIEAVLARHPAVREAVVLAREDQPDAKRLVAYHVPDNQSRAATPGELRTWLSDTLPHYMVPAGYVALEKLPLTPHGKIDRAALPIPNDEARFSGAPYIAPRTREEEVIALIWCEVLRLEKVGIHENFFELGGHSLLAVMIVSRIEQRLQLRLPLRTLFEHPTIAGIATTINAFAAPAKADDSEVQDEFVA